MEWLRLRDVDGDRAFLITQCSWIVSFERVLGIRDTEPGSRPRLGSRRLDFPIAGIGRGDQRADERARRRGDFIDRVIERCLVGFGRRVEAAQLSNELQRGGTDFVFGCGRVDRGPRPLASRARVAERRDAISGAARPGHGEGLDKCCLRKCNGQRHES